MLLAVGTPREPLTELARQGAAAMELANRYTDVFAVARRRKETAPAAELQQNMLPPRTRASPGESSPARALGRKTLELEILGEASRRLGWARWSSTCQRPRTAPSPSRGFSRKPAR